jgi:hypothetical protein
VQRKSAVYIGVAGLVALGTFATRSAHAGDGVYDVYRAPFVDLEVKDVQLISEAKRSVDFAAYVLSDQQVIGALVAAAERGVHVRLYFDPRQFAQYERESEGAMRKLLATTHVEAKVKAKAYPMHLKA